MQKPLRTFAMVTALFSFGESAEAQESRSRFQVAERSSLAWWQISPHLNHLWASTCPGDPSWQPGDERSSGWNFDPKRAPPQYHANIVDTIHVPLFQRPVGSANPTCPPSVSGAITTTDSTRWTDVRGHLSVRADRFVTGLDSRDRYATKAVLQADKFPFIGFTIDSMVNVRPGDTLTADVIGTFELRGVSAPTVVPVKAWRESDGLRVTGKFTIPTFDMIEVYEISQLSLGLGVGTGIWKYLHMGFDVVLRTEP